MTSPAQSFEQLLADLAHPNPNIRDTACSLMAEYYSEQAMPELISLLHDPDPAIYRTAVKGLGMLGQQSLPGLLDLFKETDNGTVKACCIKALVQVSVYFPELAFPVETIDGRVIGDGKAGPLTLKIRALYFELIKKVSQ